jgi:hypothetical protein
MTYIWNSASRQHRTDYDIDLVAHSATLTMNSNHFSNHGIAQLLRQGGLAAGRIEVAGSAYFFVQGFLACTNKTILESFNFSCIQGPFNMVKLASFTSEAAIPAGKTIVTSI